MKKIILALLLLASCAAPQDTITIGVIAPLSGPNAWIGDFLAPALELSVQRINEDGGINGKTVTLVFEDASASAEAATAATKLVEQDGVDALYSITTPVTAAASAIAQQNKVPMFAFTAVDTFAKMNDFVFSDLRSIESECGLLAEIASQEGNSLAFLGNDADFSVDCFQTINTKVNVLANEMKISNEGDARTQLLKIKKSGADGLVLVCWPNDCNVIFKQMEELDITPRLFLPVALPLPSNPLSTKGINKDKLFKDAIGVDQGNDPENPTPELAQFIADLEAFSGKDAVHAADSSVAFDNIQMLAEAMRKCQTLDGTCVRDRLQETDFTGVAGHVAFNGQNNAARSIRAIEFVNGKWVNRE